jgi:hypothetical protein
MGHLQRLNSKAQRALRERAGGTIPGGYWLAEKKISFGARAQIGNSLFVLLPLPYLLGEPDPGFSHPCGDMMLESAGEQVRALLTRLRIPERLRHLTSATFSGSEQQGVNIARNQCSGGGARECRRLQEPSSKRHAFH